MDINKPVTNPALIDTIKKLRLGNASANDFWEDVLRSRFLCPVSTNLGKEPQKQGQKIELKEATPIVLQSVINERGDPFLMAFTDWDELRKWSRKQNQQAMVFSYDEYREVIIKEDSPYQGMVINPFGENIVLNKELLCKTGGNEEVICKGESVSLGIPRDYPKAMVDKLKEHFAKVKEINKAYLLWMVRENGASYLLVLDSSMHPQRLVPLIGKICKPFLENKKLDIVLADSNFGKDAIKGQLPFFKSQISI